MENVLWLSEIKKDDLGIVGPKSLKLANLYKLNLPIPQAFTITSNVFKKFLANNNLKKQISSMLANLDFNNFKLVHAKEDEIREIIMKGEFPEKTRHEIFEAYNNFNVNEEIWRKANKTALDLIRTGRNLPYAALRCSSLLNEDNVTFLNVKGISSLITITKKCFASSYNFNNIYYREHNKINHDDIEVAVIVQRMISSEKSGLVYINKETNDIKIEAIHGMCELLLDKAITPNYYSVNKYELFIKDKELSKQFFYITRDEYGNNTKKK